MKYPYREEYGKDLYSPLMFNVYCEHLFQEALIVTDDGIIVKSEIVNNLRYVDGTVPLADYKDLSI